MEFDENVAHTSRKRFLDNKNETHEVCYVCKYCGLICKTEFAFLERMKKRTAKPAYKCSLCDLSDSIPSNFYGMRQAHIDETQQQSEKKSMKIVKTDKEGNTLIIKKGVDNVDGFLYKTMRIIEPIRKNRFLNKNKTWEETYDCKYCSQICETEFDFLEHNMKKHAAKLACICSLCDVSSSASPDFHKDMLQAHIDEIQKQSENKSMKIVNTDKEGYTLIIKKGVDSVDGFVYKTMRIIEPIRKGRFLNKNKTWEEMYDCKYCGLICKTEFAFLEHNMIKHAAKLAYICTLCDVPFSNSSEDMPQVHIEEIDIEEIQKQSENKSMKLVNPDDANEVVDSIEEIITFETEAISSIEQAIDYLSGKVTFTRLPLP